MLALLGCTPATSNPGGGGSGGSSGGSTGGRGGSSSGSGGSSSAGSGGSSAGSGGSSAGSGGSSAGSGGSGSGGSSAGSGGSGSGGAGGSTGGSGGAGGSSAGSGGTGGGGTGGSPGDGPAPEMPGMTGGGATCGAVPTKFCDDWEQQMMGMPPSGPFMVGTSSGASVVVDGTRKFSGTKSLHYKTGGGRVMLKFTQQFPIDNQHGRLMLYVPNKIASNNHWDMIQSHSSNPNHWELGGMYGNFELVVDPPDNGIDSKTPFPFGDKWHCIQWNFKHPDGLFVAKVNGAHVDASPVMGKWKSGRWQDLTIGWELFSGSYATEFWIDDLAFGEQEIPCPAAP
jgi:hypothetical protein